MNRTDTPFLATGGMTYSVQLQRLALPGQPLHLRITSRYADGRQPEREQVQLALTLSDGEHQALLAALQVPRAD